MNDAVSPESSNSTADRLEEICAVIEQIQQRLAELRVSEPNPEIRAEIDEMDEQLSAALATLSAMLVGVIVDSPHVQSQLLVLREQTRSLKEEAQRLGDAAEVLGKVANMLDSAGPVIDDLQGLMG